MLRSFLVILAALLCSCATWRPAEEVTVSLVNLQFREVTMLETAAEVAVRIDNENPFPIELEGAVHKIYLNNVYLGKGLTGEPLQVPRLGSATQHLTIHLSNLSLVSRIRSILDTQSVAYRLESRLYGQAEGRRRRLNTSSSGRLDLADFQPSAQPTLLP